MTVRSPAVRPMVAWLLYVGFVVYGSLVPLDWHPLPFDDAWRQFQQLPFLQLGIDDATGVLIFGTVAAVRLVALYVNGRAPRGSPLFRMFGAILGASLFSMLSVGFAWPYLMGQTALSSGPGVYATLALCDALSIWRSGGDVRMAGRVS